MNISDSFNFSYDSFIDKVSPDDIFNVRCFWIKGWNVFDVSPLQREN